MHLLLSFLNIVCTVRVEMRNRGRKDVGSLWPAPPYCISATSRRILRDAMVKMDLVDANMHLVNNIPSMIHNSLLIHHAFVSLAKIPKLFLPLWCAAWYNWSTYIQTQPSNCQCWDWVGPVGRPGFAGHSLCSSDGSFHVLRVFVVVEQLASWKAPKYCRQMSQCHLE